jgi:ArsR family transcriptional regulator
LNLGFTERELRKLAERAGLEVRVCEVVAKEKRPPHFEVISLIAHKPGATERKRG